MKKLINLGIVLSLAALILNSCKKQSSETSKDVHQKINSIKEWYQESQKNEVSRIGNTNKQHAELIFKPEWDKARIVNTADGFYVTAPVETNLTLLLKEVTDYFLVFKQTGNKNEYKIVSLKLDDANQLNPDNIYQLGFEATSRDISNVHNVHVYGKNFKEEQNYSIQDGIKTSYKLNTKNNSSNVINEKSNATNSTVCIDYYYELRTYDTEGNMIDFSSTYLGTHCYGTGNVPVIDWIDNGGESGPMAQTIKVESLDETVQETTPEESEEQGTQHKIWTETWIFGKFKGKDYEAIGYSVESLKTKKTAGHNWQWDSVTNSSFYTGGLHPTNVYFVKDGYSVNYWSNTAEVTITWHLNLAGQTSTLSSEPQNRPKTFVMK